MQRTCKSNFNAKLALLFKQSQGGGGKEKNQGNRNQLNVFFIYLEKNKELLF